MVAVVLLVVVVALVGGVVCWLVAKKMRGIEQVSASSSMLRFFRLRASERVSLLRGGGLGCSC